ncbi:unnamed protein product [Gongylonema pulchrum]|uniref:Uncharacterized protein n=1 Tax=Gongylonema pulchrum TaxID=637853 RepID=A0A3P6S0U2_9BILA|nr:unnamed protein product [Gongylonema pulchrum]
MAAKCAEDVYAAQAKIDAGKTDETKWRNGQGKSENTSNGASLHSSCSNSVDVVSNLAWRSDARLRDPHLRKYFFKQRADSNSVHPPHDYRCTIRKMNNASPKTGGPVKEGLASKDSLADEEAAMVSLDVLLLMWSNKVLHVLRLLYTIC